MDNERFTIRLMGICPYCKRSIQHNYGVVSGLRTCGRISCEDAADREDIQRNERRIQEAMERRDSNVW